MIEHRVEDRSYFLFNMIPSIDYDKQNFVIETRIKQQSGPLDQSYGLRFSIYKDYSNYRTLYVAPNGYYKVSHYYSEEDHKPVDWTDSSLAFNQNNLTSSDLVDTTHECKFLTFVFLL